LSTFGQISLTAAGDLTIRIVDITGAILSSKTYARPTELPLTTTDVFVQSGEVSTTTAVLMARCNNAVNSAVTFSYNAASGGSTSTVSGSVTSATDYTISVRVTGLTANTRYSYSATCVGSTGTKTSRVASFKTTPPADAFADVKFVWAADLAGQGWGRWPGLTVKDINNVDIVGGYPIFQTMQSVNPDFAVFQGDMIYADNPCPEYVVMPEEVGGSVWYNNPSKPFVAVTVDDFRFNWKYNHGDAKMQNFLAQTPIYVQWDDHEVSNNWFPGKILGPPSYPNGTSANALAAASLQAFYEFNPLLAGSLIYRRQSFGKHMEIFFVDLRSYRSSNVLASVNTSVVDMMGATQLAWFLSALRNSTATWKILSMDDPISLITGG
jgi:alkaline phosphatase D